jgi:glycosyltransferase involved in cell wall biosynthesis
VRIVFDVSYVQRRRAGYGRAALELLKSLLALDNENRYTLYGWSHSLDREELLKLRSKNVRMSLAKIPGPIKRFYWNRLRTPPIKWFVKEFDIFHSMEPLLPPVGKRKSIATLYDLSYKRFPEFFEDNILRWDNSIARSLRNASAIVVPSQHTKVDLLEFFRVPEDKVHVIHLSISEIFHVQTDPKHDETAVSKFGLEFPFALFVGTLEPRKNIVCLMKAFELAHREKSMKLHLVLVGKRGWLSRGIFDALGSSPVRDKIHYLEYVADEDIASLYRLAQFLVYPSMYEGYGLPVLEAMASGLPVLTTRSSSLKEIAEGAAMLVDPENVDELAHAIGELIGKEILRGELSKRGLERVKRFSAESAGKKVLDLYESLMSR